MSVIYQTFKYGLVESNGINCFSLYLFENYIKKCTSHDVMVTSKWFGKKPKIIFWCQSRLYVWKLQWMVWSLSCNLLHCEESEFAEKLHFLSIFKIWTVGFVSHINLLDSDYITKHKHSRGHLSDIDDLRHDERGKCKRSSHEKIFCYQSPVRAKADMKFAACE